MNVGYIGIYPWRPHVEHLLFLDELARRAGHATFHLQCIADFPTCYNRLVKRRERVECVPCIAGGVPSYPLRNVTNIDRSLLSGLSRERLRSFVMSSSYTLSRAETPQEFAEARHGSDAERLMEAVSMAYENTARFIQRNQLDRLIVFNGRMDVTRAAIEAASDLRVPFVTYERPWFSNGIQLNPMSDCLSLRDVSRLVEAYSVQPLTASQTMRAGALAASRFLRRGNAEWRTYNRNASHSEWPLRGSGLRIVFAPGSRNEVEGHPDWMKDVWADYTEGFDALADVLDIGEDNVVVRLHPNWSEKIGAIEGGRSSLHYEKWAVSRNYKVILPADTTSTEHLVAQADLLITTGSSVAIQAALMGIPSVQLGHAFYDGGGFSIPFRCNSSSDDLNRWENLDQDELRRCALRFLYTIAFRFPQYTDYLVAESPVDVTVRRGASPAIFDSLLRSLELKAYDDKTGVDQQAEDRVIALIAGGHWEQLIDEGKSGGEAMESEVGFRRRVGLNWIESLRRLLPRGDQL